MLERRPSVLRILQVNPPPASLDVWRATFLILVLTIVLPVVTCLSFAAMASFGNWIVR